jgi:MGT family glycosyltransferase
MKLPSVSSASLMPLVPRAFLKPQVLRLFLPPLIKGMRASNDSLRLAQALGEQYGVRPLTRVEFLNAPGDLIISYSSAAYVPLSESLPENVKLVGWTWQENATDESFVHDSPRPLIYISLGTVANENLAFFQTCVSALADSPYDVLISTGGRFNIEQFGAIPDNIMIKAWVPQTQVLQQAGLFITHGGLNSVHEGLYCGLPLLVVPQQAEQTFNGMRVAELGAGLMLKPDEVTETLLRERVRLLLSDTAYSTAADRLSQSLRDAGGVERGADEIENLIADPR